jgi:hypothetical protein
LQHQSKEAFMKLVQSLAAALLALTLINPAMAGGPLSPQDIKNLAPGRYAVNVMGLVSLTVSMRPNGVIVGEAKGKRDSGVWLVQGQKLCVAWNNWYSGKRRCVKLSGSNGAYQGGGLSMRRI